MMSIDDSVSVAILTIHGGDYCCIIVEITMSETINLLRNADLSEIIKCEKCFIIYKV